MKAANHANKFTNNLLTKAGKKLPSKSSLNSLERTVETLYGKYAAPLEGVQFDAKLLDPTAKIHRMDFIYGLNTVNTLKAILHISGEHWLINFIRFSC